MKDLEPADVRIGEQSLAQRIKAKADAPGDVVSICYYDQRFREDLLSKCHIVPSRPAGFSKALPRPYFWPGVGSFPVYLFDLSSLTIGVGKLMEHIRQPPDCLVYLLGISFQANYLADRVLIVDDSGRIIQVADAFDWVAD